jgi:chromatin remodeling complex protein RSC6
MKPSAPLAAIVGSSAMPRSEVTRKMWSYIKRHGLVDKKTGRKVSADSKLRPVFGGRTRIRAGEVPKLVNRHLK